MLITCPKCGDTLRKGSWEIFTHCPSCGLQWPVDPDEPQRVKRKITRNAALWTIVGLIPVIGIVGGMVGAFWGYLAVKIKRPVLGTTAMIVGIVVGAMGQSLLAWWAFGEWDLSRCQKELTTLAGSIRAFRDRTGHYPPKLPDMKRLNLPAPSECPGGGNVYFYLAPGTWAPASRGGPAGANSRPSAATNQPTVESQPNSAPAPGDARTLMVAEVIQGHRRFRMCITTDLEVRAIGQNVFEKLMAGPQNAAFAKRFWPVWAAATEPDKKPDKKPRPAKATKPATATAPKSKAASGPAALRTPPGRTAATAGAAK